MPKGSVKKINKKKTKRIRKTNKKNLDKYIGKVVLLKLPNNKRKRYFWIVRKKNDRYIIRSPKTGVLIRDLKLLRENDYGPEKLMPLNTKLS